MSRVTASIPGLMSFISSNVFSRLCIFFVISIPVSLNNVENVYQVSGQPWFFGFNFGSYKIHFPGFSTDVFSIIQSVDSPLKLMYYIIVLGTIWSSSFLLVSKVLDLFMSPLISLLCAIAFHINTYVLSVFLSAPVWDFFPKIHLFFLVLLVIFRHSSFDKSHKDCSWLFDNVFSRTYFILFVGAVCISIRYSSINIIFLFLILIVFSKDNFTSTNLPGLLIRVIFVCLFLYVTLPGKLFSLKVYFVSSIYHSNYALIADLERMLSLPFLDPEIVEYVDESTIRQLLIDKFYFTDILKMFGMYLEFLSRFSLLGGLFSFSNVFSYLVLAASLLVLTIILSRKQTHHNTFYLFKLYVFSFIFTAFMAYLSRSQFNQDMYLLFFEYLIIFSSLNEVNQRFLSIRKHERNVFAFKKI